MNIILIVGQVIFGGFFLYNGVMHFKNLNGMAGYAGSKGVPAPKVAVAGSGLLILLGGLGVIFNYQISASLVLISIFLLGVTPKMHAFWKETDPQARGMQKIMFLKNSALLGACLMLFALAGGAML